jgi:hypothetical protein
VSELRKFRNFRLAVCARSVANSTDRGLALSIEGADRAQKGAFPVPHGTSCPTVKVRRSYTYHDESSRVNSLNLIDSTAFIMVGVTPMHK